MNLSARCWSMDDAVVSNAHTVAWQSGDCILVRNRENNYTFPAFVTRTGKTGRPMARWEAQFRTRKGTLTKETCIDGLRYEVAGAASPADVEHLRTLLRQEQES
ncbi:MAG: hypothetical protein KJZ65_06565 [Phycisphaerales bacterium]|nr:hypothetical protein [Phycisphaerales bacterium]